MSSLVSVAIHPSQFPENIQRDLRESLRTREINHKFHYDSVKQTQKWLALHQAWSPSRTDPSCTAAYESGFVAAASRIAMPRVQVIGLGCGGGQKDARLLHLLVDRGKRVSYSPCDVSTAMVLTARQAALSVIAAEDCHLLVCDLQTAEDLAAAFADPADQGTMRITTFFGMIPNFEPQAILPKLVALVRPGDGLLFSANLAPGPDYAAGVQHVLPQYDNPQTRDWLLTFVADLGVERGDGDLQFSIEPCQGLKRIVARFHFQRPRTIEAARETFAFRAGDTLRLFFSFRYTPELVRTTLIAHGLKVSGQWITPSEEEGVFLCERA